MTLPLIAAGPAAVAAISPSVGAWTAMVITAGERLAAGRTGNPLTLCGNHGQE